MGVRSHGYQLIWRNKDVTRDVAPYLISLNYTDYIDGKTDEIELTFENRDGRWLNRWYPKKGDEINARIWANPDGDDNIELNAGSFYIDEISVSGPPDVLAVKALASDITQSYRQLKTRVWENTTLWQVLNDIATGNGIELEMERSANSVIRFLRIDQREKSDLAFIKEITGKYGYNAKIDTGRLIVSRPGDQDALGTVLNIRYGSSDLKAYKFDDKAHNIYRAATIIYHDPVTKKDIEHTEDADDVENGDVLKINGRVENQQQAIARAKAELEKTNRQEKDGEFTHIGHPWLTAGTNILLTGFGIFDGKHAINEARHSISRSAGYVTNCKVRRIKT